MNVSHDIKIFTPASGAELQIMICALSVESALQGCCRLYSGRVPFSRRSSLLDDDTVVPSLSKPFNAISVVRQKPLGDHPVSLWIWASEESFSSDTLLWSANLVSDKEDIYDQTYEILCNYQQFLISQGMNITDNCVRTWFLSMISIINMPILSGPEEYF